MTLETKVPEKYIRKVRSFVCRAGRLTPGQQRALEKVGPQFLLNYNANDKLHFSTIFHNDHPVILEIGFGMGHSLLAQAAAHPENNYLGIEVHTPGVGALLSGIEEQSLTNIRIICHDAVEVLANIPPESLNGVQIFFPDPWHKKRHHKRRIIQSAFVEVLVQKLKPTGYVHCATDWQHYAEHMLEILSATPALTNTSLSHDYVPRPNSRPVTKFETRGLKLGHGVWDLVFTKI